VAATLALVAAFTYLLADSGSKVRESSEKRFGERAQLAAALTESLFATAGQGSQKDAAKAFGAASVDRAALARLVSDSGLRYALILDSRGRVLAASPGTARLVLRRMARVPGHVRQALRGRSQLSGLVRAPSGRSSVMEWAVPFETRHGRRVQLSGMRAELITQFLGAYLARARSGKVQGYVADGSGHVIADASRAREPGALLPTSLARALVKAPEGKFPQSGEDVYFSSAPVAGTTWRRTRSRRSRRIAPA
jgi:hypothetical protein